MLSLTAEITPDSDCVILANETEVTVIPNVQKIPRPGSNFSLPVKKNASSESFSELGYQPYGYDERDAFDTKFNSTDSDRSSG